MSMDRFPMGSPVSPLVRQWPQAALHRVIAIRCVTVSSVCPSLTEQRGRADSAELRMEKRNCITRRVWSIPLSAWVFCCKQEAAKYGLGNGLNVKGLFPGMRFAERVQRLLWLLEFPNKGPCRLLVHACLPPLSGLCPGGQRAVHASHACSSAPKEESWNSWYAIAGPYPEASGFPPRAACVWCVLIQCLSFPLEPGHFPISALCLSTSLRPKISLVRFCQPENRTVRRHSGGG